MTTLRSVAQRGKNNYSGKRLVFLSPMVMFLLISGLLVIACSGSQIVKSIGGGGQTPSPTLRNTATRVVNSFSTNTPQDTPTPTLTLTPTITLTPTLGIGSIRVRPLDDMVMLYVPRGEFSMGTDDGYENEKPPHTVALDDYWIDQTEVTNIMFRQFVDATGYRTDAESLDKSLVYQPGKFTETPKKWVKVLGADWLHPQGPDSNIDGLDDHPVVQISWNDAAAYCAWAGGRLPTEAEWELAARGTDGRLYPWGNQSLSGTLANSADSNLDAIWATTRFDDGYKFTSPVGHYPQGVSPFGTFDMAGNAAEWVFDIYEYGFYSDSPFSNPTGPAAGYLHVLRGGQWSYNEEGLRSTARIGQLHNYSIDYSGFRCAMTP
jgi:formylglycine-generating enzyme required for sulfatase activity